MHNLFWVVILQHSIPLYKLQFSNLAKQKLQICRLASQSNISKLVYITVTPLCPSGFHLYKLRIRQRIKLSKTNFRNGKVTNKQIHLTK